VARLAFLLAAAGLLLAGCGRGADPAYVAEIDQWHADRVESLSAPDGWLTLVGLHPLPQGSSTVGSAGDMDIKLIDKAPAQVGVLTVRGGRILFAAYPKAGVFTVDGTDSTLVTSLELQTDRSGKATVLSVGSLLFYVIDREGSLFLRVKDRAADLLKDFAGVPRFPVDRKWRLAARLEKGPETTLIPNVLGQKYEAPSPGVLVFDFKGRQYRLTPQGEAGGTLFLVFGDATNGHETYSGGRFLDIDPPLPDGSIILDFNKCTNPPCVFTPYATCPLPPPDNVLDLAVTAGEKMWGEQH